MGPMWTTVAYCATCDGKVRPNATDCPHCGVTFKATEEASDGV